jgi:hypothetical protein
MEYRNQLILQVVICVVILFTTIIRLGRASSPSVGLPIAYLLSMAMLHWMGMFIHGLPWYETHETDYVALGGRLCVIGVIAFAVGSLVIAPTLIRKLRLKTLDVVVGPELESRLPETYMVFGLIFYFILMPILSKVPSFAAMSTCGVSLLVIGLCLACWRGHLHHDRRKVFFWLALTAAIPAVTVTTMGFMGYGASAAMVVFVFVLTFYRPKWHGILAFIVATFLGLSLFITYFRDRTEIRERVWGQEEFASRIERISETFQDFEFIDFHNDVHLDSIDGRLNQNVLVGRAADNLSSGSRSFAKGETITAAFVALIPRILWPGKPIVAGSGDLVARYTGLQFSEGTSVGIGQVMELYINFGTAGIIVGFTLIGIIVRLLDTIAAVKLRQGNWPAFMAWFLPSMALLQTGGQFSEVTSTAAASAFLAFILNKTGLGKQRTERQNFVQEQPARA